MCMEYGLPELGFREPLFWGLDVSVFHAFLKNTEQNNSGEDGGNNDSFHRNPPFSLQSGHLIL